MDIDGTMTSERRIAIMLRKVLREWMTPAEFAEMRRRNKADHNPLVCHSHDFCDANEAMLEAFRIAVGREADVDNEADCALWNAAWNLARQERLV